jgi:mannose-6-phosphate isomerase-like protein (cupin superfamily)
MSEEIVALDEGERTSDRSERTVMIKADSDAFTLTWSRYEAGQSGPGPHVHREHDDCFYVLDGELLFEAGPDLDPVRGGPGTFVLVPPLVVHTFRNESAATAHFLNIHAPGCGFADYLRALRDGRRKDAERFDSYDPPDDGGRPADEVVVGEPQRHVLPRSAAAGDELRDVWILDGALTLGGGREAGPGTWVPAGAVEGGSARVLEIRG